MTAGKPARRVRARRRRSLEGEVELQGFADFDPC
jgi:hypothetical protein